MKTTPIILLIFLIVLISFSSCDYLDNYFGTETGSIHVSFNLNTDGVKKITDDFTNVSSGTVFLKQSGVEKYSASLTINTTEKTGEATLSDIHIGTYDIVIELYDNSSPAIILYSGTKTAVTINAGSNGTQIIQIDKHIASLSLSGSWTEDVSGLDKALVELRKDGTVERRKLIALDTVNKEVHGALDNIYPTDYELSIEIQDGNGNAIFGGTQTINLSIGANSVTVTLELKTGSVSIQVGGDVVAPSIITGPTVSVSGQDVTIEWETDEKATSNVCYSTNQNFDYKTTLNWAPLAGDLGADTTAHSVGITGMDYNTYYFVVVSVDESGNMIVSDEGSLVVEDMPDGLIAYYSLEETSGAVIDKTRNGYDTTSFKTTRGVTGKVQNAFYFTASNWDDDSNPDYVEITETGLGLGSQKSFTLWANVPENTTGGWAALFGNATETQGSGDATTQDHWSIKIDPSEDAVGVSGKVSGSSFDEWKWINYGINYGDWYFIAVVMDDTLSEDSKIELYVNGEPIGTISDTFPPDYDVYRISNKWLS